MKKVSFSLEEIEPLATELIEFLVKKFPKCSPENSARIIGALRVSEKYFMESLEQVDGSITMGEEPTRGH